MISRRSANKCACSNDTGEPRPPTGFLAGLAQSWQAALVPGRGPGIRLHPPNHPTQTGEIPAFAGMTWEGCGNDVGGMRE